MNRIFKTLLMASCVAGSFSLCGEAAAKTWVTGYVPGYEQAANGDIPYVDAAGWQLMTHAIHNSAIVKAGGGLDFDSNALQAEHRQAAIRIAHQHDVPILFGVSGWIDTYKPVLDNAKTRQTLIGNIVAVLKEGYDGVDIDLEPLTEWGQEQAGNPSYVAFARELKAAMQGYKPPVSDHPLLMTSIMGRDCVAVKDIASQFDQINLMLYDLSGTAQDMTWHDSALYSGKAGKETYPGTDIPLTSVDYYVKGCAEAGLPTSKLGLGINLETRLWIGGVTAPRQAWGVLASKPKHFMTAKGVPQESYTVLLSKYFNPKHYQWDDDAKVPYLAIDNAGTAQDMFISFNDERSVAEKVRYQQQARLGGIMLWNMALDYNPSGTVQHPIMQSVRTTLGQGTSE